MTGHLLRALTTAHAAAVTDGGAVETVAGTIEGVSTDDANGTVSLYGCLALTTGAKGTAVVVKCRRGSTTAGAEVATSITVKAAEETLVAVPFAFTDKPGAVANQPYVITVTETSATADGTVHSITIGGLVN